MATKRKAQERVQNYPSLFREELGAMCLENTEPSVWGDLKPPHPKKARRNSKTFGAGSRKGEPMSSREKRNSKLWASLYPTPKR